MACNAPSRGHRESAYNAGPVLALKAETLNCDSRFQWPSRLLEGQLEALGA